MNTIQRTVADVTSTQVKNEKKDFSLKQGQVIVGRVKETNSDGTTTILVGNKEISAKIQGNGLRDNGVYAFKVVSNQDGTAELKPYLPNQMSTKQFDGLVEDLLSQFRLGKGNDQARTLLEGLLQKGSPLERQSLVQMLNLVGNQKLTPEVLHTLDFMNKNSIPFEKNIFQAVMAANTKQTLSNDLQQLIQNIQNVKSPVADALKQWFIQFDKSQQTLQTIAQAQISAQKQQALPIFQKGDMIFQNLTTNSLPKLTAESIMGQIKNQFPTLTSNDIHVLVRGMNQAVTQVLPKVLNQLGFEQGKQLLQTLINVGRMVLPSEVGDTTMQGLDKIFSLQLSRANQMQNSMSQTTEASVATAKPQMGTHVLGQSAASQANVQVNQNEASARAESNVNNNQTQNINAEKSAMLGKNSISQPMENQMQQRGQITEGSTQIAQKDSFEYLTAQFMKNIVGKLGLNYEHILRNNQRDLSIEEQLKPLLLQAMSDDHLPPAVRKDAESLLNRLTGLQVMTQTADVSLQSYHMSIPLFGFGLNSDLEVCWQGKRKEKGDLDPDFCRVIFDVELGEIGRTVMDMQIVDRIIRLGIYTEEDITETAHAFVDGLEVGIENLGYQLGNLNFHTVDLTTENQNAGFHASMMEWLEQSDYKGFDIRI